MAAKKKRSPRASTPSPTKAVRSRRPPPVVGANAIAARPELHTPLGVFQFKAPINPDAEWQVMLQRASMEWTYVVRNRQRWRALNQSASSIADRARKLLLELGLEQASLERIAECGVVEVVVPYLSENVGWEARIFPWEFVIASATRELRQGKPITVSRMLKIPARVPGKSKPKKLLYVESAPGALRNQYEFESEQELIDTNLGTSGIKIIKLSSPTLLDLRATVAKELPDIIHLAGFDSHEGTRLLKMRTEDEVPDGYLLAGTADHPAMPVDAQTLGAALTLDGKHRPALVSFSINNSAARSAAMMVAAGAHSAIAIQDTIDDSLVELFYAGFYRTWRRNGWNLHLAFRNTWQKLREQSAQLSGTGLVLWSDSQLVSKATTVLHPKVEKLPTWLSTDKPFERLDEILKLDIKPLKELNYAQLHNKRPLFENFTLINASAAFDGADQLAVLADVEVDVTLSAGAEETSYRCQLKVDGPSLEMRDLVHVPLISELMRTVNEAINTSLQVQVKWGRTLFRDTFLVRLLPVDQWRDNNRDGQWLPSFVLPRDRAVPALIEKAQHYVRVVRDDPSAGFDGYQSFDPQAEDPAAEIDLQVQAIWSMLVHELQLGYVNPPPGYSNELDSQRLRTPSMIVQHRSGTCIDLALLVAACLENVDIYPVIFLLQDHAFPGYWRNEDAYLKFIEVNSFPADSTTERHGTTDVPGSQTVPWWFRDTAYKEIVQCVESGALVPLESVWLTEHSGFADAIEGGRDNLKSARRFHSMLDIVRAREAQVTPLPIGEMP